MISNFIKTLSLILCVFISGCAAFGVPVTFDPDTKIKQAITLLERYEPLHRPLPAEPLIWDAIEIYKEKDDQLGLAEAYKAYAFFLYSTAVGNWEKHYREKGFMDKSVTFDERQKRAIEYYEMAKDICEKNNKYDCVSNIYFTIGSIHHYQNNPEDACNAYRKCWESHLKFRKNHPSDKVTVPPGYNSFEEYMDEVKIEAGCQ